MIGEGGEWGMEAGGKESGGGDGRRQETPKTPDPHVFHHGPPWTKGHPQIRPTTLEKNGGNRICETTVSPMVARFEQDLVI